MVRTYWVYHKLEDTSTMKESSEEERKWCKLVYISIWIKLHCSVLYIGWTEAGKQTESKSRITNYLTNPNFTRGMNTTNSLNCTYTNYSRFAPTLIILNKATVV